MLSASLNKTFLSLCYVLTVYLTGSTLDTSFRLLHEAEEKLKSIVTTKFDAAVHAGDVASVERFFKIFPLLGQHDEGLTKFGKYLSAQVLNLFIVICVHV